MEGKQDTEAAEIIALEKKYWQGMVEHDLAALLKLTHFPCLVAGPQGMSLVDKDAYVKMFESREGAVKRFEFLGEPQVRLPSAATAVIGYRIRSTFTAGGEEKTIEAVDTSTWIREAGEWTCALHTETELRANPAESSAA